jgi:NADPH-dependent 2,4-dienoyl-CoA reductase/sulfur reductase-like enzyme
MIGTTAYAATCSKRLLADSPGGTLEVSGNALILAAGARELLLPFPGWTLPGVFGSGGLETLAKSGWPVAGKRVVIAGSSPLLWAAAGGLKQHGARIVSMVEQAPWSRLLQFALALAPHPGKILEGFSIKLRLLDAPLHCGSWPLRADGDRLVETVTLTNGQREWTERCDYLACGFGLVPNVELAQLLGCRLQNSFVVVDSQQQTSIPDVFCAGELTGIGGMDCALVEGEIAGLCAAGFPEEAQTLYRRRDSWRRFQDKIAEAFALRSELKNLAAPDTIVCRCEDVRRRQIDPYQNSREAKLQTRCGMGPCQGRICGAANAFLRGWDNDSVRPPVLPVPLAALASHTPMHLASPTEAKD